MPQQSMTNIILKITHLKCQSNFPEVNKGVNIPNIFLENAFEDTGPKYNHQLSGIWKLFWWN